MEAVLKYPGAKNRLAEWIISFIPEHRVYLELFFGSGAVFFNKDPAKIETLNDLDGEVYNLFKVIRDRPEEFAKSLEMTPYSREEYENAYKKVSAETELERARKFMVRCWLGMGSSNVYKNGFRSSQQGNSPKTTKHWGELPDRVLLAARRQGIKTVWVSEIEPDCIDIAKRHFPEALQLGDITQIDGAKIPVVDIISFGSPCQDLSVAGRQAGLDGSRSGLFMEAVRITREMREKTNGQYPKYIIWENVAGAFSSNKGEDFRRVLEEITQSNISMPKSGKWATAGMVGNEGPGGTFSVPHGDCLTLNFGECPNVENVSTLSMILETDVPDKYFLSAKACWGIIRRAEQRNKEIPVILKIALLERIAEEWQRTQTDK